MFCLYHSFFCEVAQSVYDMTIVVVGALIYTFILLAMQEVIHRNFVALLGRPKPTGVHRGASFRSERRFIRHTYMLHFNICIQQVSVVLSSLPCDCYYGYL